MNFNSVMLIIANLSKEFVICCCLWLEHIPFLFLTLIPCIWAEHGRVLLQIFTCSPSQSAWRGAYLVLRNIHPFSELGNAKRELQCLGTIFMSHKPLSVCVLTAEQHLPSPAGSLLPQGQLRGGPSGLERGRGWRIGTELQADVCRRGQSNPESRGFSQASNTLTLEVQLLPQSFFILVIQQAAEIKKSVVSRSREVLLPLYGGDLEGQEVLEQHQRSTDLLSAISLCLKVGIQ